MPECSTKKDVLLCIVVICNLLILRNLRHLNHKVIKLEITDCILFTLHLIVKPYLITYG